MSKMNDNGRRFAIEEMIERTEKGKPFNVYAICEKYRIGMSWGKSLKKWGIVYEISDGLYFYRFTNNETVIQMYKFVYGGPKS